MSREASARREMHGTERPLQNHPKACRGREFLGVVVVPFGTT
jgi:hypothetical protein